jgi:haloalkane dehalogenase
MPVDEKPADVHEIVPGYAQWLTNNSIPKPFVNADPGVILTGAQRELRRTWANQQDVTVKGTHFVQEDSPAQIGQAIARFLADLPYDGRAIILFAV